MYMGDSRGHWEGDTLVIETTNLNGRPNYSGAAMKIIERITRLESDEFRYEATIDDPKTYTRTVRIAIPMTSPPGYQMLPYECHEGNSAVRQGLSGARVQRVRSPALRSGPLVGCVRDCYAARPGILTRDQDIAIRSKRRLHDAVA